MKKGASSAGVNLEDDFVFASPSNITVEETRTEALKLATKLNKLRKWRELSFLIQGLNNIALPLIYQTQLAINLNFFTVYFISRYTTRGFRALHLA